MDFYLVASSRPLAHGQITWMVTGVIISLFTKLLTGSCSCMLLKTKILFDSGSPLDHFYDDRMENSRGHMYSRR